MPKLTKDQKREKKKREERKLKLRKEHEQNHHFKKLDGLMTAISMALEGVATQEDLDAAVLRLGGGQGVAISEKESRFQSPQWSEIKASTTRMVDLLQTDDSAYYSGLGLQGRLYLNGEGNKRFSLSYMPIFAVVSSGWAPEEVVHQTAVDLEPEPTRGAYFFGVAVRDSAIHFACASTADPLDTPEIYFVSPKGWHRLDLRIWREELWPCLCRAMFATDLVRGPSESQYAIAQMVEATRSKQDPEADLSLDDASRVVIRGMGSELALESEVLVFAADAVHAWRMHEVREQEWNAGFASRQEEVDTLDARCRNLERERNALQRPTQPSPAHSGDEPPASPNAAPARPLNERMAVLLGL